MLGKTWFKAVFKLKKWWLKSDFMVCWEDQFPSQMDAASCWCFHSYVDWSFSFVPSGDKKIKWLWSENIVLEHFAFKAYTLLWMENKTGDMVTESMCKKLNWYHFTCRFNKLFVVVTIEILLQWNNQGLMIRMCKKNWKASWVHVR